MKIFLVLLIAVITLLIPPRASAQAEELQQLLLNIEKLAQFKQILSDLKKGYDILFNGYTTVKNIAEGNFSLHKAFLDGLLDVNPAVKNYSRVAEIVRYQQLIVQEYKQAIKRFGASDLLNPEEINYISSVYANLTAYSLKNLDALLLVITPGTARMNDGERIGLIDAMYKEMEEKLSFLRWFNNSTNIILLQRAKEKTNNKRVQELYGVE